MKYITIVIITLTLICHPRLCCQTNFQYALFKKKHTLKAEDLKPVQKDGKTSWTIKTTLTNRSRHTLYYFITNDCDGAYYSVDTMALFVSFPKCDSDKLTVIAVKPKEQRIVELEISPVQPLTASVPFRIVMFIFKAKNMNDNIPHNELVRTRRPIIILSNQVKT